MTTKKLPTNAISKFSIWFVKNFRVSIILLIALTVIGTLAYTQFLKREGFPAVQVPVVLVQTPFFVDDADLIYESITQEIEESLSDVEEITQIQSTTTPNFSNIVVELDGETDPKEGLKDLQNIVTQNAKLPDGAEVIFQTFDAATINGEYNMLFTISKDESIPALQTKGELIVEKLEKASLVRKAEVIELVVERTNPITEETFEVQESFNRIGLKEDGMLAFTPALSIGIVAKPNAGAIELSESVRSAVDQLIEENELSGYEVIYNGDFAEEINEQISSLEENALSGLIAVVVIVFLLVNWRASILGAMFIPIVMASTFVGLYLIGYSLNVISLFALILVLGLFVDDAIVVIEAIDYQRKKGLKGMEAIARAVHEIGPADISGTLTTILVFLPMAFTSGVLGEFIQMIPITVILALSISLFVALTIIPLLSYVTIANRKIREEDDEDEVPNTFLFAVGTVINFSGRFVNKLGSFIGDVFVFGYLKSRILSFFIVVISLVLVMVGGSFASRIDFSVFPSPKDSVAITIGITFPEDSSIEQAELISQDAEKVLNTLASQHIEEVSYFSANENSAVLEVQLTPIDERNITSQTLVERLQNAYDQYDYIDAKVDQVSSGPPAEEFPFAMQIFASEESSLVEISNDIDTFLRNNITLETGDISEVKLDTFDSIRTIDGLRFTEVKAKVSDPRNTGLILEIQDAIKAEYDEDKLDSFGLEADALGFDLGQESDNLESFESALFALIFALVAMYALLVLQFNSFLQPVIILLAVPLSFPGLFPGLYATNNQLSFFVTLGIMGLVGIVVNNTILLVDFANQAQREGKQPHEAIAQAVRIRFRPIITTTATTIAGLYPLAISDPFWESLAFSIIFGLISSSILVLLFFPVYYVIFERIRQLKGLFIRKQSK